VFKNASQLSDDDLFRELAKALLDSTEITNGKIGMLNPKLNPKLNPEPGNRFASLINEAMSRGFQREDIGFGMRSYWGDDSKFSEITTDPVWKSFEQLVARIHVALCREAEVKWSEKLIDSSGIQRQIDVTIRSNTGPHPVLGIVQCKHEKRPVTVTDVEAFITTKNDVNVGLAIIVSSSGYQKGARAKAKQHDVRLWTLHEAEKVAWRTEFRVFQLYFHMFDSFEFHPTMPEGAIPQGLPLEFDAVTISQLGESRPINNVFATAIQQASERCLPLPCWFDMQMPESTNITIGGQTFPLNCISFHFVRKIAVVQQKKMSVPLGSQYTFKCVGGKEMLIADRDLPPLDSRAGEET
jgi:hypothetical protein